MSIHLLRHYIMRLYTLRQFTLRHGVFAAVLVAVAVPALAQDSVRFTVYQPTEGESWQLEGSVRSELDYQVEIGDERQEESSSSLSEFDLTASVTRVEDGALSQVRAQWDRAETITREADKPPRREVSPLQGRAYLVDWPASSPPTVTRPDGSPAPPQEVEQVLDGLGHLASPGRLSEYFAGQGTVEVGRVLRLPGSLLRDAFSSEFLRVQRMTLTLRRVVQSPQGRVGVFDASAVMVSPAGSPYRNQARVDGELWVREEGSRIMRSTLSGPVSMSGEWGDDPPIRMTGQGTVESVHDLTLRLEPGGDEPSGGD